MRKFERYQGQFLFLYRNKLETVEDLQSYRQKKQAELEVGVQQRKKLYSERRNASEERQAEVSAEIAKINEALRPLRREIRQCGQIMQDAGRLQAACKQAEEKTAGQPDVKRPEKNKENIREGK